MRRESTTQTNRSRGRARIVTTFLASEIRVDGLAPDLDNATRLAANFPLQSEPTRVR
jgi:hypothetical protein